MNFKMQFDEMIDFIENNIRERKSMINKHLLDKYAYGNPDKRNAVFEFITGMKIQSYIAKRKLIRIYEYTKLNSCNHEEAAEIFNHSSGTNFSRDFRKEFGIPATEMTEEMYDNEIIPSYVDVMLSKDGNKESNIQMEKSEVTAYGLPKSKLEKIKQGIALSKYYDFNEQEEEFAYQLANEFGNEFNLNEIYMFCSDYFDNIKSIIEGCTIVEMDKLAWVCLNTGMFITEAIEVLYDIEAYVLDEIEDYRKIPKDFWKLYNDETFDRNINPAYIFDDYMVLKEKNYKYSEIVEILNNLSFCEDIYDAIDTYDQTFNDLDDLIDMGMIEMENSELDTYTDDFLGISHNPDDYIKDISDEDEKYAEYLEKSIDNMYYSEDD